MKTIQSVAVTVAALATLFGVLAAFFHYYEKFKALV
jgi:ABC-type spermidine/putrescine transport system permease subunit II